jgi:hypothetical protein
MSIHRRNRTVAAVLAAAVALAVVAWIAGEQIRSPAQIAAETAAPRPSAITVPVERRMLSTEVIVRGTVRYGSPQNVELATSELKQNSGTGADIITSVPRPGRRFGEGTVAMTVAGRPVFVLRGAQATHRDLGPGSRGPDVRQLEKALARMGSPPGRIDGRYDGETAAAVARWYESRGWEPVGATDFQLEQLRTARATSAAARDAYLQSRISIRDAATQGVTPGDIAQSRIDLETARDAVDAAKHELATARIKARSTSQLARLPSAERVARLDAERDNAAALVEITIKRAAVNKALDDLAEARRNLEDAPPDSNGAERAALRQAGDEINVAQAELNAAVTSANATRAEGTRAIAQAASESRQAVHEARTAAADLVRSRKALPTARRQVVLAARRLQVLRTPGDASLQRLLSKAAGQEARETAADAARLARKVGISVPADEVLFFPTLPLRVDAVKLRRGDSVTGRVMTVSNSRLAVDSSLSLNDAKLVRLGASVVIEESDLGVRTTGVVTRVADRPGTHKVDPTRVYAEITPKTAPAQLVGASVKLTIAVNSSEQPVLAVPVTALSVGADGSSRIEVQRTGRTEFVTVAPGLAAKGLVEVRPVDGGLAPGDLVIVGAGGTLEGGTPSTSPIGGATDTPSTGATLERAPGTQGGSSPLGTSNGASGSSSGGTTSSDRAKPRDGGEQPRPGGGPSAGSTP